MKELKILYLYPDILELYGDFGNIQVLRYRLEQRGIKATIVPYSIGDASPDFNDFDLVFAGGSGSWWINNIPRYLNSCNLYASASYLNTLQVSWNCSPARDWTQYRLNGGNWIDAGDAVAANNQSGWFNIRNLSPNTTYSIQTRLRRADSGLWSESNTISMTTKDIARITSPGNNFSINSDSSLTVQCTNPSGNQIAYFLDCPSGTRRLTSGKTTSTSYTWTKEQILSMLQYSPNSNSISIKVGIITY